MASIIKKILTGSTDGLPITVSATTTDTTTIHAITTATANIDEVWLYAYNSSSLTVTLTVVAGGATASGFFTQDIPGRDGFIQVMGGMTFQGNATSRTIVCGASTSMVVQLYGWVNRITQT
jgi:hypothetical protein